MNYETIKFIKKLSSHKTTKNNPKEIIKCLKIIEKKFSNDFIIKKFNFKNRPMMVFSNTEKKRVDFILAGHIDVVSGNNNLFKIKENKDKLLGRGVFDMKATLIMSIYAIRDYLRKKNNLKIAIFITTDEEIDGLSVKYLINKIKYKAKFAIIPDGGSDTKIITQQKGFTQIKLTITGKTAHASCPFNGSNPIDLGINVYKKILNKYPMPENENNWRTSICLTKIKAGDAINQIPKKAIFYFDIRYTEKKHVNDIKSIIKNILKHKAKIEIIAENDALIICDNNQYIVKLKKCMKNVLRKRIIIDRSCETSDAIFLSENGIPAILFRPKGGGEHQDNEWISKKSLSKFYDVMMEFLKIFDK